MATWDAVQSTLLKGGEDLLQAASSVTKISEAKWWAVGAFFDYPDPLVKIIAASLLASLIVFLLGAATNNYRYVQ